MKLFHRHGPWKEVGRTFSPGAVTVKGHMTTRDAEALLAGFTTVELRCEECGQVKTKRFVGDLTADNTSA